MANRGMMDASKITKDRRSGMHVATLFLKKLNSTIETMQKERKPSKHFTPSSLMCMRQMYYKANQYPYERIVESSNIGIGESGTDRHDRLQKYIAHIKEETGFDCEYIDVETYIKEKGIDTIEVVSKDGMETLCFWKEKNLNFKTDGILKIMGDYFIFELKTEVSFKWNNRKSHDKKHEAQGICYSQAFNIDKILYLYENRDLCKKKAFIYTPSKEEIDIIMNRIDTCLEYIKNEELPPKVKDIDVDNNFRERDYFGTSKAKPSKTVCMYCGYAKECDRVGD